MSENEKRMEEGKTTKIENSSTPLLDTQEIVQEEKEEVKDEIKNDKEEGNEAKENKKDESALEVNTPSQNTDIAISVTPSLTPQAEGKPANKKKALEKEKQLQKQKETRKIREAVVKLPTATIKEVTIDDILELKMSRKMEQQSLLNMGFSRLQSNENVEESAAKYKSFPMFKSNSKASIELEKDPEDESILADDCLDKIVSKNKEKHSGKRSNEEKGSVTNKSYDPLQERIKRWDQEKEEIEALATRYTSGAKRKQDFMEGDGLSTKILDENSDNMIQEEHSGEVIIDTEALDNGHETDDMGRSSSVQELDRLLPQESQEEEEEFMLKCRRRIKQNKILGPSDLFTRSSSLLGSISGSQDIFSSSSSLLSYDSAIAKRASSTSIDEYHDHNSNSEIISNDSRSSSLLMARNSLRKSSTIKSMDSASKVKKALFSTVMQSSSSSLSMSANKSTASQTKSTAKKQSTSEPPKKVQKKAVQKQLSFFK